MQSKKIAITGGIGSGKSLLAEIFRMRGFPVFSCDEVSRKLWTDGEYLRGLSELFPVCVREGTLDKAALSKLVFSDENERKKLNGYAHPRIMERLLSDMVAVSVAIAEVPLLYEGGYAGSFDFTVAVLRERTARLRAAMERDGLSEEEVRSRMRAQYDWEGPLPAGCIPVRNDGTREDLEREAERVSALLELTF